MDTKDAAINSGRCCTMVEGFSLHSGVCVPARDRIRLERLLRYASRPPLSTEGLSLLADGRLLYKLKRRWSEGTTHVIHEPMELMERLAALLSVGEFDRLLSSLFPAKAFAKLAGDFVVRDCFADHGHKSLRAKMISVLSGESFE
jgi:hypothetical protein